MPQRSTSARVSSFARSSGVSSRILFTGIIAKIVNGQFSYPLQKRAGIYTFELQENSPARLAEDPSGSARGVTLCKRLRAGVTFDVVAEAPGNVAPPTTQAVLTFVAENDPQAVIESARVGDAVRLRADLPDATGDEVTVEISSLPIPGEGS